MLRYLSYREWFALTPTRLCAYALRRVQDAPSTPFLAVPLLSNSCRREIWFSFAPDLALKPLHSLHKAVFTEYNTTKNMSYARSHSNHGSYECCESLFLRLVLTMAYHRYILAPNVYRQDTFVASVFPRRDYLPARY